MQPVKEEDLDDQLADSEALGETDTREQRLISLVFGVRSAVLSLGKSVEKTASEVSEIHERLFEPDTGLFARVKDTERKVEDIQSKETEIKTALKHVDQLVSWRDAVGKVLWYSSFTGLGVVIKYIFDVWVSKK